MRTQPFGIVRVTHIPSGEFCVIDQTRSQHKNKDIAINLLKSRLYSLNHGITRSNKLHSYVFPDDIEWPDDVKEYKENVR